MLNECEGAEEEMHLIKNKLTTLMNSDQDLYTRYLEMFGSEPLPAYKEIMHKIGNPLQRMHEIYVLIKQLTANLKS